MKLVAHRPLRWGLPDCLSLAFCSLILLFMVSKHYLPSLEGRFFPVVAPAQLFDPESAPPPPHRHNWSASTDKLRNCEYVLGSLRWYLGSPEGARVQVVASFHDKPQIRTAGAMLWNSLKIDLDADLVAANSYATVRHKCPYRWWETESVFYLSDRAE